MRLIIESGSTKADWLLYTHKADAIMYTTHGINPTTLNDLNVIRLDPRLEASFDLITSIHYYGAGINSMQAVERIKEWLSIKCKNATDIHVAEDCLAAARACFGDHPGYVGILGTGSNSSYYDGHQVFNLLPTLGFIISDEGGGTYLGKEILRAYFYNHMPEDVRLQMESKYISSKTEILYNLYRGGEPNRFLASYASLLTDIESPWSNQLVFDCLRNFLEIRVIPFYDKKELPLSFVGSIAHYHQDKLDILCKEYGIALGEIIHKPLDRLLKYHLTLPQ